MYICYVNNLEEEEEEEEEEFIYKVYKKTNQWFLNIVGEYIDYILKKVSKKVSKRCQKVTRGES